MVDGKHVFYCLAGAFALVLVAAFTGYWNATDAALVGGMIGAIGSILMVTGRRR